MKRIIAIAIAGILCLPICAQKPKAVKAAKIIPQKVQMFQGTQDGKEVSYVINGTCPSDVNEVILTDAATRYSPIDTIKVTNGKFTYQGKSQENTFLGLTTNGNHHVIFIADGTPVSIDMSTSIVKGSALNEKLNKVDLHLDEINGKGMKLIEPYMNAQKEGKSEKELLELSASITEGLKPIQDELTAYCKQVIKENQDNVIPAFVIPNVMYDYSFEELKEITDSKYVYANHPMMAPLKRYIVEEEKKQAIIGKQFIDLEENDVDGKAHKLSEYVGKGNYVLIDFWASWCGPCMAEMPNVKANYEKYKAKGFNVVGLSFDRAKEPWVKTIKEKELNWVHLSDLKFWQSIAASTYSINSIPASLLVDPTGKVIARDLRGDNLGNKLAEIYGE